MNAKIILLNGPAGVGKTTIGRTLAATARNGVCIHGDDLKNFIVTRDLTRVAGGLAYKNAASLACNFIDGGYELVVVDFVFEQPRHVQRFCREIPTAIAIHLVTLWAPLATVLERERSRPHRARLGERVIACYRTLEENLPSLGYLVHNVDHSPAALAAQIAYDVEQGCGLLTPVATRAEIRQER